MVVSVQPAVIAAELELMVAEVAEVVVVLACAAVARLLGVAGGLVAEEQKMGVDYNTHSPFLFLEQSTIQCLLH
jgi:hypothetical protein